jgi:xanthine/uracil permease
MPVFDWASILIIMPAALVVISEHIGHLFVTSNIVGRDLLKVPGLHNSLLGDGLSTMLSSLTGSNARPRPTARTWASWRSPASIRCGSSAARR